MDEVNLKKNLPAPKLHLIKPVRDYPQPCLTAEYVRRNAHRGIATVVIPDVNIIYAARDVFLRRITLADSGLEEFRNFLAGCPGLDLAPYLALSEVPPNVKAECVETFNVFLEELCGMRDHPSATPLILPEPEETGSWNTIDALIASPILVLPPYYVTKIHSMWLENPSKCRISLFNNFLDEVVSDIDLLSAIETEVAAFCFCDEREKCGSQPGYSNAAKTKIATIRKNFLG